jgi:hypothetical protein
LRAAVSAAVQLLGLDYLVDDNMHPWLLEVNGTPSLAVEHGDAPVEQLIHSTKVGTRRQGYCTWFNDADAPVEQLIHSTKVGTSRQK